MRRRLRARLHALELRRKRDSTDEDAPLALPHAWATADTGVMPPWERLVRTGRDCH